MQESGIGSQRHAGNKYTPFPTRSSGTRDGGCSRQGAVLPQHSLNTHVPVFVSAGRGEDRRRVRGDGATSEDGTAQLLHPLAGLQVSVPPPPSSVLPLGHVLPSPSPSSPASTCSVGTTPHPSATYMYLYKRLPKVSSDTDYERLGRSMHGLQEGCFYYPDLDSNRARAMLQGAPEGTFLVRDSSDPRFLFALTVKTARGATSVRIQYHWGFFQLDCEEEMSRKLPRFETLLDLLDFHSTVCRSRNGAQFRWQESSRRTDMVVRLTTPRRHSPPSLSHLARVAVNRTLEDLHLPSRSTDLLPLPAALQQYLRSYPFKV